MLIATQLLGCHVGPGSAPSTSSFPETVGSDADTEPRLHHKGEIVLGARGYYGLPILNKSLFWDGNGEVSTLGGDVFSHWFLTDSFALGAGLGGTVFQTPGDNALGAEPQASARWYPYMSKDLGVFVDGTVGYLRTTRDVPPRGTQWNYTFSFGPGIDVPICHNTHMLIGSSYHHISNALGRQSQRNPSQNEVRLWLGFEWTW